jgi:integrase
VAADAKPLTDPIVRALKPGTSREYYPVAGCQGLQLVVQPSGAKLWYLSLWLNGKSVRVPLGRHPDLSVRAARDAADRARTAAKAGEDPRAQTTATITRRGTPTVAEFWQLYLERHGRERWKDDQAVRYRDLAFARHWQDLAHLKLDAVTMDTVQRWYDRLARKSISTANKEFSTLRSMYNCARKWRNADGIPYASQNPADGKLIDRKRIESRDRYLTQAELLRLRGVLAVHPEPMAEPFFLLALLTGARKGNLRTMRADQVDLGNAIWNIPAGSTKGRQGERRAYAVPMVPRAVKVFQERAQAAGDGFMFPGAGGKASDSMDEWWREIRVAAGIDDVTIHDLRRTVASWLAITGASEAIIAQLLGHKRQGVTAIYARLDVSAVRRALDKAVKQMFKGTPPKYRWQDIAPKGDGDV